MGGIVGLRQRLMEQTWMFKGLQYLAEPGHVARLRKAAATIPHASWLDVGCGFGRTCLITDAPYLGLDVEPRYIAYAQRHYGSPGRRFLALDATRLEGQTLGSFEVVSFINVIHHFADEEMRVLLSSLASVKPRYYFVADVALENAHPLFWLFRLADRGNYFRSLAAQRAIFERAGYRVVWSTSYLSLPSLYPKSIFLAQSGRAE
jgi:SAM-dependent methyltransferase